MLARQGAAELEHQVGHLVGDPLEPAHPVRGLQVDHRAHVQAAHRRVRVDAGDGVVAFHQREEPLDVVAQPLRRHRRVLDERHRLAVALHGHRQAERRLAEAPDARLGRGVGHPRGAAAQAGAAKRRARPPPCAAADRRRDRRRTRRRAAPSRPLPRVDRRVAVERRVLLRVAEDEVVHHLHRRRSVLEDERRRAERVEQLVELERQHGLRRRQRHQRERGFDDEAERALGADDDAGEIDGRGRRRRTRPGCSRRRAAAPSGTGARSRRRASAPAPESRDRPATRGCPRPWPGASWSALSGRRCATMPSASTTCWSRTWSIVLP